MAEWLCSGLQIRVQRFDSASGLHPFGEPLIFKTYSPRIDTYIGMGISNLVGLFIVITTAATLNAHGVTDIQTSARAAEALVVAGMTQANVA
jgi:hypothetical protein